MGHLDKTCCKELAGGTVDRNQLANAGDMGSIPGPGRCHMLRATKACTLQLLEPVGLEPVLRNEGQPPPTTREQPVRSNEDPVQTKIN